MDNIYEIKINNNNKNKYPMSKKLKLNNQQILKLNNNIYIPFQLHNLPNYYNKINPINIIKLNSLIYINISYLLLNILLYLFTLTDCIY